MSSNKEKKISIESGWGARIKEVREKLNLTQAALAKQAGLGASSGYISELEREMKIPGGDVFYSLSRVLGVSMDWIFTGEGSRNSADYSQGLPKEIRDVIQKAAVMVLDFVDVVPVEKQDRDKGKIGLFIMTAASLLAAGRQDEIPALMTKLIRSYSDSPKHPLA